MRKIKKLIPATFILVALLAFSFPSKADGVFDWDNINSTFEDGAWHVLERCQNSGDACSMEEGGSYRALVIEPE